MVHPKYLLILIESFFETYILNIIFVPKSVVKKYQIDFSLVLSGYNHRLTKDFK